MSADSTTTVPEFVSRHIGPREDDVTRMLEVIGQPSVEELIARTAPAAMANFTGSSQFEEPTGSIAAAAIVITIPIIIFVVIFQRRIVAGLTSGAVKG